MIMILLMGKKKSKKKTRADLMKDEVIEISS